MYEETESTASTALTDSGSEALTTDTINLILSLTAGGSDNTVSLETVAPDANGTVTVTAGTEVVFVATSDTETTTVTVPSGPVILFQGQGGVIANIGDGATTVVSGYGVTDRVIVGSAGFDNIVLTDSRNSQITLGGGDTVVAGGGADTIVAGLGNSTVVGGSGFEVVQLSGVATDYTVNVIGGNAVVTNAGSGITTSVSNVQFIQLGSGQGIVFAQNSVEAAVTTLYQTTFGRLADADGLGYWFDLARAGVSLDTIAQGFVNSAEYQSTQGQLSNTDFITSLYMQTFGRSVTDAELSTWEASLSAGTVDRADILTSIADLAGRNIAGTDSSEATIVGTVVIVPGIFG